MNQTFQITLPGLSTAEANQLADDLANELANVGVDSQSRRESAAAMDFGTSLAVFLGAPSVIIAARALHAWVKRNNVSSIRITDARRELVAENLESKDVSEVVNAFMSRFKEQAR